MAAILSRTACRPSALLAPFLPSARSSAARSLMAARSSAVKPSASSCPSFGGILRPPSRRSVVRSGGCPSRRGRHPTILTPTGGRGPRPPGRPMLGAVGRALGPGDTGRGVAAWSRNALALLPELPAVHRVGLALAEGGGRR